MRSVLYLRMSTDKQETSIGDQRAELTKYAEAKGYRIVGEYVDEAISGDATEKRLDFQRMRDDCGKKRFDLILCWDQDRFGRFDPLEGGYWIKPIRDAGVQLETVAQGRINWNDFASRLVWTVTQEAKHAYLRTLARDCVRGLTSAVEAGVYPGAAPFGYRKKNKRLVLGPDAEVETIREIFRLKLTGMGYRTIANVMRDRGTPAPGRGQWNNNQVRYIINREVYVGRTIYGKVKRGKYENMPQKFVRDGTHDAIIDEPTWKAAQLSKRESTVKYRGGRITGALTGLLTCGLCGHVMYRFKYKDSYGYICGTYHRSGRCGCCRIMDDQILPLLAEQLRQEVGDDAERLRKQIERRLKARQPSNADELPKRLAAVDRQIDRATGRLLTVDDETFAVLNAKVQELRDSRQRITDEIDAVRPRKEINAADIANRLCSLPQLVLRGMPETVREAVRLNVESITVHFRQINHGRQRRFFEFESLEIKLRA